MRSPEWYRDYGSGAGLSGTPDEVARAVGHITAQINTIHAHETRLWQLAHTDLGWTICECDCLLLYATEPCPNCGTPMPKRAV